MTLEKDFPSVLSFRNEWGDDTPENDDSDDTPAEPDDSPDTEEEEDDEEEFE